MYIFTLSASTWGLQATQGGAVEYQTAALTPSINDNDVKHRQRSLCKREVLRTTTRTQISKFATGKYKKLEKLHIKHSKKFRSSTKIN